MPIHVLPRTRDRDIQVLGQPDWRGAVTSALVPVALAALVYAALAAGGYTQDNPAFAKLPFDPSGWTVAVVWVLLFGLYGLANWGTRSMGPEGSRTHWLVIAMMVWAIVYTVIAGHLSHFWLEASNLFSLALGMYTASRLVRLSRRLVAFLVPSFLWKVLAVAIGLAPVLGFTFK